MERKRETNRERKREREIHKEITGNGGTEIYREGEKYIDRDREGERETGDT